MTAMKLPFEILRFAPGRIDPPRVMTFDVTITPRMSVLDGLEQIRLTQAPDLMYRHSCHHRSCGTCACLINGVQRLACATTVGSLNASRVHLAPLPGFRCKADLVVDMSSFYSRLDEKWSYLRLSDQIRGGTPAGVAGWQRLEDCIECGSCVSACPVTADNSEGFMGPAALAALSRQIVNCPEESAALTRLAAGPFGERHCRRALDCSRVCPTGVYPARHIADLRKDLDKPVDPA